MADLVSPQYAPALTMPPGLLDASLMYSKLRVMRAHIDMAVTDVNQADNVLLGKLPPGARFLAGIITASATLGSAQVAIGTNKAHASNGQYRAAATFTAVDTPTLFGLSAAQHAADASTETPIYLTTGAADLPASGRLSVFILYSIAA